MNENKQIRKVQTGTHWGAYELEVDDNNIVGVQSVKGDSDPSSIGKSLVGTLNEYN